MTVWKKTKSHQHVVGYFQELPFYNKHIEKTRVKGLKKHWFAFWFPCFSLIDSFYEELNVIKTSYAFRGNTVSYKVELVDKKNPIKHLEASKLVLKTSLVIFSMKQKILNTK